MPDHSALRLGKAPAKIDPRTLKLAKYLTTELPTPPASVDWTNGETKWTMALNDTLGDCVIAAIAHCIQGWTQLTGNPTVLSNDQILSLYEAIGGYNPADPSTDQGCVELTALNYWSNNGCAGDKLAAYVAVTPSDTSEVKSAISLFGNLYTGFQLPLCAQTQDVWDVVPGDSGIAGSWGGHAVPILAYDAEGLTCITWGALKKMTWAFFTAYCDEAYALLSDDWLKGGASGTAPSGLNLAALQADLAAL